MVMSVSYILDSVPGQSLLEGDYQYFVHILLPLNDILFS